MRRPRIRVTVGRSMLAIALLAGGLWWGIARPYPLFCYCSATCQLLWSDGSFSTPDGGNAPTFRGNSWLLIVHWPDGTTGYYLTVRPPVSFSPDDPLAE